MSTAMTDAIRKSVVVDLAPRDAFELFTAGIASWWPVSSHSYGGDDVTDVVFERRAWEPPESFVLDWRIGDAAGTEVEVRFGPEGPGTRVELEHRGFGSDDPRGRYQEGWGVVLAQLVATAARNA
jgi:uncharacterized protein YndB with AHSA1/START domain